MRAHVMAIALSVVALVALTGWSHATAQHPTILVQERREEFPERRERREEGGERRERCERMRDAIFREERAERGERAEGDRREAHEIRKRLEELQGEYREHRCAEVLERR